jgi:hypothetical protein
MFGKTIKSILSISVVLLAISLSSCRKEIQQYTTEDKPINEISQSEKNNTLIAQLPIKIDSANYIIFPIGQAKKDRGIDKISYSKGNYYDYYLDNIIFQNISTNETHLLSKSSIKIVSFEQLRDHQNRAEKLMIYTVIDDLSSNNSKEPHTVLYVGSLDGKIFKRMSPKDHQLHNWKYISEASKIYYQTLEDTDGNGEFDSQDRQHLYSLSIKDFVSTELLLNELKEASNLQ